MSKIFAIGFHRMGTLSLNRLFSSVGLKSYHGPYHLHKDIQFYADLDSFTDGEQHDFKWLDKTFPGSKFILLDRDVDDWVASRIKLVRWCRYPPIMPMVNEYQMNPEQAVKAWKDRYHRYRSKALDYFKGDLLEMNVCEDSPEKLYDYIGVRGEMKTFPHLNKAA